MAVYRMKVAYDGTSFHGWQLQPDARTIQGGLEEALGTLLRRPVRVAGAGRTDAGVHALGQIATFDTDVAVECARLLKGLNALLRPDISVQLLEVLPDHFDPRRAAVSRLYEYRIWNQPWHSPFCHRYSWHIPFPLKRAPMEAAARRLVGEHDFSTFRAADCESVTALRKVRESTVAWSGGFCIYRIEANAFVKGMVRSIVGTLVQVGRGEMSPDEFARALESGDRSMAGPTAPARGLFLVTVRY